MSHPLEADGLVARSRVHLARTTAFCASVRARRREWLERVGALRLVDAPNETAHVDLPARCLDDFEVMLREVTTALVEAADAAHGIHDVWSAAFDCVPLPCILTDRAGRIRERNAWARRAFGDVGEELDGLIAPQHGMRFRDALAAVCSGRDVDVVLAVRSARGSDQLVTLCGRPLGRWGRVLWFTRVESETARATEELEHVVERQREELARERVERERMRAADVAKDQLFAVASHDLRSPVSAVLGWTQMLRSGRLDAHQCEIALQTIERNARVQGELIAAMLDVSRIRAGKLSLRFDAVDVRELVGNILESASPAAETKGITLRRIFDDAPVCVHADLERLRQALTNVVANALRYTPARGAVTVTVESVNRDAIVRVVDTGRGIAREDVPHLFERFRQGSSGQTSGEGLGLGLYVAREMIQAHGGRIEAESAGIDHGATFTVTLPRVEGSVPPPAPSTTRLPPGDEPLLGTKILVVEDDDDTREVLSIILENYGGTVTAAPDASSALALLASFAPDVVVADVGLPDTDGYELVRSLRSDRARRVPALAVTGFASDLDVQRALHAGFDAHIAKPVSVTEIVAAVARLAGSALAVGR